MKLLSLGYETLHECAYTFHFKKCKNSNVHHVIFWWRNRIFRRSLKLCILWINHNSKKPKMKNKNQRVLILQNPVSILKKNARIWTPGNSYEKSPNFVKTWKVTKHSPISVFLINLFEISLILVHYTYYNSTKETFSSSWSCSMTVFVLLRHGAYVALFETN